MCIFQDLDVLLGEHDLTTAFDHTFRMSVSRIVEHPLYNPLVVNNDYSILILREEVRYGFYRYCKLVEECNAYLSVQ